MAPPKGCTVCDGISLSEDQVSELLDESKPWIERKPIGVRFNPSDRALARICADKFYHTGNFVLSFIKVTNVYEHEPWELSNYAHEFGEEKMYFFTTIRMKYGKGKNIDRTTPGGFWQKTGPDSTIEVMDDRIEMISVSKTSLAFYKKDKKSEKKEKTPWLMKQYMLKMQIYENFVNSGEKLDLLALCVVYFQKGGEQPEQSGSKKRPWDERNEQNSMPDTEVSSSLPPPIQNDLNACCYTRKRHCHPSSISTHSESPISTCSEIPYDFSEIPYDISSSELPLLNDWFQSDNEHGSDQQHQPSDSAMTCYRSQSFDDLIFDEELWIPLSATGEELSPAAMAPPKSSTGVYMSESAANKLTDESKHRQPNSHGSRDQFIQQKTGDSAMAYYLSQQNPAEITPTAEQPSNHHSFLVDNCRDTLTPFENGIPLDDNVIVGSASSHPQFNSALTIPFEQVFSFDQNMFFCESSSPIMNHHQPWLDTSDESHNSPVTVDLSSITTAIANPNLIYQNSNSDLNLDLSKSFPPLYPCFRELLYDDNQGHHHSVNELGSNQQEQPNSYRPSDQIIQQQPSDSAMTCYRPSQPWDDRYLNFDEYN